MTATTAVTRYLYTTILRGIDDAYKSAYSQDPPGSTVHFDSDSEFAQAIQGMDSDRAWAIVDDLVATLWAVNKPLYNALMRQIKA